MFNIQKMIKTLQNFDNYSKDERGAIMYELLTNDNFKQWLFNPDVSTDKRATKEELDSCYTLLCRAKALKAILRAVNKKGFNKFTRDDAVLLNALSQCASQQLCISSNKILEAKKKGNITNSQYNEGMDKLEDYRELIDLVRDVAKEIVKDDGTEMANECNIPKKICRLALTLVPSPKYLNKYKIGFYMSNLLSTVYQYVDEHDSKFIGIFGDNEYANFRWSTFFKRLLGRDNAIDSAMFILLEGLHRIDNYTSESVKECWNSLTDFALKELDKAPDTLRTQMMELYVKRLTKFFGNGSYDLRIDLTSSDLSRFPNLKRTVEKFEDKIKEVINKFKK